MTNVPSVQFTPTGLVIPSEQAVLVGVQADIDAAFGGGVNPGLTTPQGQLATSEAAIIGNANEQFLFYVNNVDPAFASGRMQDGIGRIYFLTREPATSSVVQCLCTGAQSTIIPVGALATDGTNLWVCQEAGTISSSGNITLPFACQVTGPVAVPANSVNRVYQTIPGWDTVNNVAEGVLGTVVESRADFEFRREQSVAQNSLSSIQAIVGKVFNVPSVIDVYGIQNDTGTDEIITGVTVDARSIFVCVAGGDAPSIAQAIWSKKTPGCGYTGNTTEVVQDQSNGYTSPYPSYTVKFQTAAALPILFAVNINNSSQVPANATVLIQNVIINAFTGSDGGARARIGSTLYASRYYAGIASLGAWAQIVDVLIGSDTPTHNSVTVPIDSIPTIDASDIVVNLV